MDVAFWVLAVVAAAAGVAVFVVDSMARATFALLASLLAVGGIFLLLDLHYLGVLIVLMMVMEMLVMAVFMIMYMMNPAGLMPMTMVHNHRGAIVIAGAVFVLLAAGALLTPWPHRRVRPGGSDARARAVHHGPEDAGDDGDRCRDPGHDDRHGGARHAPGPLRRRSGAWLMTLQALLVLAAALFAVGLYGALSQQSIVMLMMGLELMINGLIVAGGAFWYFLSPQTPDGQVLVLVAVTVMALEMAMGFAVVTALFRARDVDMTDDASDLQG
ncbi:NADH-quinone oxidoreductase subunit NuoK [Nonomuraea rubra]